MELVRKVTGHATDEIVLKHYFQLGREGLRDALNKSMPKLLVNGRHSEPREQIHQIINAMTPESLARDKEKVIRLLTAL